MCHPFGTVFSEEDSQKAVVRRALTESEPFLESDEKIRAAPTTGNKG